MGRKSSKRLIRAVHERDLDVFLESAGLLDTLRKGQLCCALCGEQVTKEEISRFILQEDGPLVICGRPACCSEGGSEDASD